MSYQTLSPQNQFTFTCPVFNADTKMSTCINLRDKVWRGERPEVRKGCQACMNANKCPAAVIAQRMAMSNPNRPVADEYFSATPVKGKLRADVLERIANVLVPAHVMGMFSLRDAEISLITSSSKRIYEQLGKAPLAANPEKPSRAKKAKASAPKTAKSSTTDAVKKAAQTGDMSAAINEGSKK